MSFQFRDDFSHRATLGFWSEKKVLDALSPCAVAYGASGSKTKNEFERQKDAFVGAGNGELKRPDILCFPPHHLNRVEELLAALNGADPAYIPEDHPVIAELLRLADKAIECEGSNGNSAIMARGPKRQHPAIHIKDRDLEPLRKWETTNNVPLYVFQLFEDRAYGIAFCDALHAINTGDARSRSFQARKGEEITANVAYYQIPFTNKYVIDLGPIIGTVTVPRLKQQKNGQYKSYIEYTNGTLVSPRAFSLSN